MKKIIVLIFIVIILSGCSAERVCTHKVIKIENRYEHGTLLFLYTLENGAIFVSDYSAQEQDTDGKLCETIYK